VDAMANKAINSNITTENPENVPYSSVTQKRIFKRTHIISHCATQQSISYHQRKYGKKFNSIDWELYKHIISKHSKSMSLLKMAHSLSPTRSRMHLQDNTITIKCQLSKKEDETIHHILKCTANPHNYQAATESRYQKKEITRSQYETTLQLLQKILNSESPPNIQALEDQIQIGWKKVLQGKITVSCNIWITKELNQAKPPISIIHFMTRLWTDWKAAWKFRNQNIPHCNYITHPKVAINETKLRYIYNNRNKITATNQSFLLTNVAEHLMLSERSITK
jgi:hypothetical protein